MSSPKTNTGHIKSMPSNGGCSGCFFKTKQPTAKRMCEKKFTLHASKSCVHPDSVIFVEASK